MQNVKNVKNVQKMRIIRTVMLCTLLCSVVGVMVVGCGEKPHTMGGSPSGGTNTATAKMMPKGKGAQPPAMQPNASME